MKKLNQKNALSATVSMLMTLTVCSSVSQASDIEIYSNATGGKVTLMLAIDTSRSMEEADDAKTTTEDNSGLTDTNCYFGTYQGTAPAITRDNSATTGSAYKNVKIDRDSTQYFRVGTDRTVQTEDVTVGGVTYTRKFCMEGTTKRYDRLSKVKDGLFDLLYGNTSKGITRVGDDKIIGLSTFSTIHRGTSALTSTDSERGGAILVPARRLDTIVNGQTQRQVLLEAIANMTIDGQSGTPSAALYAETAAYLMGTTTLEPSITGKENFKYTPSTGTWQKCKTYASTLNQFKSCSVWESFTLTGLTFPRGAYSSNAKVTKTKTNRNFYLNEMFVSNKKTGDTASYYNGLEETARKESGFFNSSYDSRSGTSYIAPTSISEQASYTSAQKSCNGQGIYFLTDGALSNGQDTEALARKALNNHTFSCTYSGATNTDAAWDCINKLTTKLLDGTNPAGVKIKTAIVGFAKDFRGLTSYDGTDLSITANKTRNLNVITGTSVADRTAKWGINGEGGWYSGENSDTVVESVNNFIRQIEVTIPSVATGSPTLPQDALNPLRVQPYGYYTSFEPKPQETTQLWAGNMNKYHVVSGELYSSDKAKKLIKSDGSLDGTATGIWGSNGMKGQLPLGISTNAASDKVANRYIFTNRQISATTPYAVTEANALKRVNVETLFSTDADKALFINDPQKNYWLNLLGYNVGASETVTLDSIMTKPELRQVGATMHSTPILLTQEGKITVSNGQLNTTDRDDYLLFGTTQGLLHVVRAGNSASDTNRGKEVFTFVPNEMMGDTTNIGQREAFLSGGGSSAGGSASLFYGIDAPWTAYTQYISKTSGRLTVNDSGRTVKETDDGDDIALKGLQWVYGGLRMGGRSYYALDLSDISGTTPNPKMKFHIDPASSKIYKASATTTGVTALSYMGQSWSKPTIAYVNFGGVKKLVMFVGGGYDSGYENAAYDQSTTTQGGAGVYMFDANSGDLLWWTSANATTDGGAEAYTNTSDSSINMKYSVVSQINAIDRDNDGLVDHLYFGDLGGQAFRVDINNAATGANASAKKNNFISHVVRLYNGHANSGLSPRFYEMPSFSIHDGSSGYVGAVALSSGNRSSPLSGAAGTNQSGSTSSAADGVFVIYDKDVAKSDLYSLTDSTTTTQLTTKNITLTSLNDNFGTDVAIVGNNGWKYIYPATATTTVAGRYKGMNGIFALDGMLYVNVFDRDGTGINSSTCGGGVKGDSYVYQFCLPTGKCSFYTDTTTGPNRAFLGGGILGTGLGQGSGTGDLQRLTVNRDSTVNCTTTPNLPQCQQFSTTAKLRQLRWYETR